MATSDADDDIIDLDGPTGNADDYVNGMILATTREHPDTARKFLVRTPALMEKQAKARKQQAKRAESLKRKHDSDADDYEHKPKKGKGKKKSADDSPPGMTYYINIPKPPPVAAKKRGTKAATNDGPRYMSAYS
ncbi:hypothetical protein B0H14DRAFT_3463339 [Mycena olivaceomarginata]|nr:hypothetical protein B0H14DRAFT_3463339 [Mycena olivaceomarginata]